MFRFCVAFGLATVAGLAQAPDYLPLQVGNQWVYRSATGSQVLQIEVTGIQNQNNTPYYTVTGFAGTAALLRRVGDQLLRYDSASGQDVLLEDFGAAVGQRFSALFDSCTTQGTVSDRSGAYTGGIGTFEGTVLIVKYSGACADAGVLEDRFLPYVGLVSHTIQTIAGPRRFDLVYANNGGFSNITAPQISFVLSLDSGAYKAGAPFLARLTLRNSGDAVTLEWFSGQRFDLQIFSSDGVEVYRWSNGFAFPQIATNETFQGERNWVVLAPLQDNHQVQLPPGKYMMQGYLTTGSPLAKKYSASMGFEVN